MDIDTADAIDTLRVDIRRVETTLSAKIDASVERSEATLRAEMREIREESKRHSEVLFESLHDDIRIIADGFASVSSGVALVTSGLAAVNARLDSVADGLAGLNVKVDSLLPPDGPR